MLLFNQIHDHDQEIRLLLLLEPGEKKRFSQAKLTLFLNLHLPTAEEGKNNQTFEIGKQYSKVSQDEQILHFNLKNAFMDFQKVKNKSLKICRLENLETEEVKISFSLQVKMK